MSLDMNLELCAAVAHSQKLLLFARDEAPLVGRYARMYRSVEDALEDLEPAVAMVHEWIETDEGRAALRAAEVSGKVVRKKVPVSRKG